MNKERKAYRKRILILKVEVVILLLLIGAAVLLHETYGKIFSGSLSDSQKGVNEDIDPDASILMGEYTNIAIFGLDNRTEGDYDSGRSDTIIIASIHNDTGEVKLVSVYRDTYLKITDEKYGKINAAYAYGQAAGAISALNTNLDLNISDYVCVDWKAVAETIDALGGLDLEITEEEMNQINKYMGEVESMTGGDSSKLTEYGSIHLDGIQATTYARIRKTKGNDFLRTSRQRIVIQAMLEKAKNAGPASLLKICSKVFDDISTSLTLAQIAAIAAKVGDYTIAETTGFPFELTTAMVEKADCVIAIDLSENVTELHKFLFDDTGYTPSQTVFNISGRIAMETGVDSDSDAVNTSDYNNTVGADGTENLKQ